MELRLKKRHEGKEIDRLAKLEIDSVEIDRVLYKEKYKKKKRTTKDREKEGDS